MYTILYALDIIYHSYSCSKHCKYCYIGGIFYATNNHCLSRGKSFFVGSFLTDYCNIEIHLHSAFEIFMATTDNIRYYIEGQTYDLQAGDLIITNTSEIHRPSIIDTNPYGRKFILFNPSVFSEYLKDAYPVFSIFTERKKGFFNHLRPNKKRSKNTSSII